MSGPFNVGRGRQPYTLEQRIAAFWSRVEILTEMECWPWRGSRCADGYGTCRWGIKTLGAHRVAWALSNVGQEAAMVLHRCDNPCCVNPAHLYAGTQSDNMRDMVSRGRQWCQAKTHCVNGHAFDSVNTRIGKRRNGRTVRLCRACDAAKFARWKSKRAIKPARKQVDA